MHNYKELKIWKESIQLVKDLYPVLNSFPEDEKYNLISQIKRSSVSVPSNIAEGTSRKSNVDFKRFLQISLGSLFEMETQLYLSCELGFMASQDFKLFETRINELQKMIYGFSKSLDS
ncbi:four helix bundle protein [Reichenbachiella sp. 5M10]|uniref:four helix bundle protein n=1 Tax=Reichenbachiella sp. 5M10 TaxID=1889772 RepID=UPI000C15965D|nr:four helix bundle protein [Reichenbachiella sp. 5M10]PIB37002.1 four helix bundle protein [Reichenbachiella sp. 5M10]